MHNKETRTCLSPTCSNTFQEWPSRPKKYCQRSCFPGSGHHVPARASCRTCDAEFAPESARQRHCKVCVPTKADRARLARYGLTRPQWDAMLARYSGMCWLCKSTAADSVDHCHETGKVRGALCRVCNMVLHYVERPGWWDDAKSYLGGDEHCGTEVQLP